ncbi:hypothetical protein OR1_00009 [Geobacter sp. OR-1]|uniref:WD40 repeat domain-containing protein n=1 Tax=Geobacter sp. OR-1 TaxID=1266765 RepID=UPI0005439FDE|nr:WD40 repeat domain-containing protein [Geobacter sp. OR-1]GAM07741.1 hypothetical protein OR1_00009 [Geobacter sp. OR-1]
MSRPHIPLPCVAFFITILISILLGGCAATLPVHTPLPQGLSLAMVGSIDPEAPFAWHPDGDIIAFVRGTLRIENLATEESTKIDVVPTAIAWSPDGSLLAAAAIQGKNSTVRIFDMRGAVIKESIIPGHISSVAWRFDGDLIAASLTLERFKFGTHLQSKLYRWNMKTAPGVTTLSEVTIMPGRVKAHDKIYFDSFSFALSPLGDEIAFTKQVDPPNFPSYLKIIVRNLESGAENEAPGVKLDPGGVIFSSDNEHLLYGDGAGTIRRFAPWTGDDVALIATPGRTIALSPTDRYLFADGRLFLDKQEVAAFPVGCEAAFAPTGSKLLVRCGESLSVLNGLMETSVPAVSQEIRKQLLSLRKWRSEGLISNQEYQSAQKRILNP